MKNIFIYRLVLFTTIVWIVGCSSSTRYSRTINVSEKSKYIRKYNALETKTGTASFYANEFNGRKTANGEIYNMSELTAAHPSYPFNTILEVTNLQNGKGVEVRINDRMPKFKNRIIDLSLAAARKIDIINSGIQEVKVEVIKWGDKN